MNLPVYIGDEVSAQGYRLAGVEVRIVDDTIDVHKAVLKAREHASLVMLSAAWTDGIPQPHLQNLLADVESPLVIVPDLRAQAQMPDLGQILRRELGVWE